MFNNHREKLFSQLEAKRRVDSNFKYRGRPRFQEAEIDLKYQSLRRAIDAVISGDSGLLQQSLPHVDMQMAVSLTIIAVENDRLHLLCCCSEKVPLKSLFGLRNDKTIEPLLYSAVLDATPYFICDRENKPHAEGVECVNRSRVLCLFKILYHKYIYLSVESILSLVQTLMVEGLYFIL
jgi:hypothetical protein